MQRANDNLSPGRLRAYACFVLSKGPAWHIFEHRKGLS